MPYGDVRVLEEKELPPFCQILSPVSFSRIRGSKVKAFLASKMQKLPSLEWPICQQYASHTACELLIRLVLWGESDVRLDFQCRDLDITDAATRPAQLL